MTLKAIHDKQDEIPEEYRGLYSEKNGKWELTGVEGVKTQADVDRSQLALKKERDDHKKTKDSLAAWGDFGTPDELRTKLDRLPELEAAAAGKLDEAKVEEIAQKRAEALLRTKLAPTERELAKERKLREELEGNVKEFKTKETRRSIYDKTRAALVSAKVLTEAHEDALLLAERVMEVDEDGQVRTKDGVGVTPGLDPAAWLSEIQEKRPHWWPPSQGGGAKGSREGGFSGGKNPWSADSWNVTEQGAIFRADQEKAKRLAAAAGTKVGGTKPMPKKAAAG